MSVRATLRASMEAISFQNGDFFRELTREIESIKPSCVNLGALNPKTAQLIRKSNIVEIVTKYTNLSLKMSVTPSTMINAAVLPPIEVDLSHPFYDSWIADYVKGKDGIKAIKEAGSPIKAGIDLNTGKVYGHYTKVKSHLYLYTAIFSNPMFTADQIAAIILHEIGHIYSYLEFVGFTFRTNALLSITTREFFGTDDHKHREILLDTFKEATHAKIDDPAALINATSEMVVQTVLLDAIWKAKRNEVGTAVYDQRSFEQLADEFATKQGAGRALAMGLDSLYRAYGDSALRNRTQHLIIEGLVGTLTAMGTVAAIVSIMAGGLSLPFLVGLLIAGSVIGADPNAKIYDDPKERLDSVRRHLVSALKDRDLSDGRQLEIQRDIAQIDHLMKSYSDNYSFFEGLWRVFSRSRKAAINQIALQKQLEELASNKLYITASKLKTLKG